MTTSLLDAQGSSDSRPDAPKGAPTIPGGRRPTPRPQFDSAQLIRREDATHHVWGDREAGFVTDRVISSTGQLHCLEYEIPPRGEFRHSPTNPTIFGGDVLYFVVAGALVLANPESGEVARAETGEGLLFHARTWHNGFNPYATTTRVVEFFAPPPSRGTASDFARRQPYLDTPVYRDDRWSGRWPEAALEREQSRTLLTVGGKAGLLTFRDVSPSHIISVLVDTPYLNASEGTIMPGHVEDFRPISNESIVVCTSGEFWVDVWDESQGYSATSVLLPGDSMFLPRGSLERLLNRGEREATYLRGEGSVPDGWTA